MCPLDSGVFVALDKLTPFEDSDSKVHVPVRPKLTLKVKLALYVMKLTLMNEL